MRFKQRPARGGSFAFADLILISASADVEPRVIELEAVTGVGELDAIAVAEPVSTVVEEPDVIAVEVLAGTPAEGPASTPVEE